MNAERREQSASRGGLGMGVRGQIVMLLGVSLFSPLMVWAHSTESASLVDSLLLGVVVLLAALGARLLLVRFRLDAEGSTYAIGLFVLCATNGGLLLDRGLSRLLVGSLVLVVCVIAYRLRSASAFRLVVLWGVIFVVAYPWLVWSASRSDSGEVTIEDPPPVTARLVEESRDLVLLVLDGYGNGEVLSGLYDYDLEPVVRDLEALGLDVSTEAAANYGRTRFSVSSVVQLDYPVGEGALSGADLNHLLEIIGGDNVLSEFLVSEGYTHTYVESGWFGTRCRTSVAECVEGPWPSESLYDFTNRTLLKDLPGLETGRSFSNGAQHTMSWLRSELRDLLKNDARDLVYAHVLAPHPPLFMDSQCAIQAQEGFKGFTIAQPGMTVAELNEARAWYARQVDCVNGLLIEMAELAAESDAILLMFGDHGPDSLGQLYIPGAEWDHEQRWERLSAFVAARVPGCDMGGIDSLVNVGRRLVSCISDADYPDLPMKAYESERTEGGERLTEVLPPLYGDSS